MLLLDMSSKQTSGHYNNVSDDRQNVKEAVFIFRSHWSFLAEDVLGMCHLNLK